MPFWISQAAAESIVTEHAGPKSETQILADPPAGISSQFGTIRLVRGSAWGCKFVDTVGVDIERREKNRMSEDAKVSGVVHLIEETKTFGNKGFRKRLVVLEQDKGSFTNYVPIEFIRDSCDSVDEMNLGDEVEVKYRLNGRRWQRDESSEVKYFLSAEAMSFKVLSSGGETMTEKVTEPNDAFSEAGEDEAPF